VKGALALNISLTKELDAYVVQKVETGMYTSASEVIREGLRLLQEQDELRQARLDQLRCDIGIGAGQIERGEYTEYSTDRLNDLTGKIKACGRSVVGSPGNAER
jgi:antitoxin ParD1/3/4